MPGQNENRQQIYDFISNNPGTAFRELVRDTGIPAGTARHHLSVLARCGLIREERHRNTLRFFRSDSRFATDWAAYAVLRAPQLRRLHAWLLANPWTIQRDVLDAAADAWGWSRSTTQHRLARLVDEGLATAHPRGRCKVYTAREPGHQALPDREAMMHPWHAIQRARAVPA